MIKSRYYVDDGGEVRHIIRQGTPPETNGLDECDIVFLLNQNDTEINRLEQRTQDAEWFFDRFKMLAPTMFVVDDLWGNLARLREEAEKE